MSGFLIWCHGPLHWSSKRQAFTARSSAETEIYAAEECTKSLQHITHILEELRSPINKPIPILNDNSACVTWSTSHTSKGLRHIQMRENCVRENIQTKFITVDHVAGKINLSDMFTKEEQHQQHFLTTRDKIISITPSETIPPSTINSPIMNNTLTNNNSLLVLPNKVSASKDLSLSESLPAAELSQILPENCTTSQVPLVDAGREGVTTTYLDSTVVPAYSNKTP